MDDRAGCCYAGVDTCRVNGRQAQVGDDLVVFVVQLCCVVLSYPSIDVFDWLMVLLRQCGGPVLLLAWDEEKLQQATVMAWACALQTQKQKSL